MKNILIVDDNHIVIDALEKKLNKELDDINILKATTYKESINYILDKDYKIDIAIIDLNLPDVQDGVVANFSVKKQIPTVVLTALGDEQTRHYIKKENLYSLVF